MKYLLVAVFLTFVVSLALQSTIAGIIFGAVAGGVAGWFDEGRR